MKKKLKSEKIKLIEKIYSSDIKDLLYDLHYVRDFKHKQIAWLFGTPRPTITRWFKEFNIPTKSCHRYTKQNLKSWLYKTGRLKKKIIDKGPDKRIQRTKGNVYINFFKHWSPEMAYVLGFFAADGGMFINSGGSKYLQFTSSDYEILEKIKNLLSAKQNIARKVKYAKNHQDCYLLQIGSKEMFNDLIKIGFTPKKEFSLRLPFVPTKYFNHFLRGYFDGDGCLSICHYKKNKGRYRATIVFLVFASGSKLFLRQLSLRLIKLLRINKGYFYKKGNSNWLRYGKKEAEKICNFMYNNSNSSCFLERKYNKFKEIFHK